MPARPAGAQGRLGGSDPQAPAAPPARSPTLWAGSGGAAVAGLLALRSDRIGRGRGGGLRLQPPAPRAGWGGGGSGCASIGGAGEWGGGAGSGGERSCRGGCINREWGTCILRWVRGGRSAQRKWKVCSARRPRLGSPVRTCWAGATETPHAELAFFLSASWGGVLLVSPPPSPPPPGVKVQEEVQPLPSFLRSERTEPGAAAPPLRRRPRLAWGRAHPAAATSSFRPPPSPGSKTRPTPPPPCAPTAAAAFAFCFLCSGAPAPARALQGTQRAPPTGPGKASERALALARRTPPPPRALAPFACAPAPPGGREGRWQPRLQEGRTSSLVYPLEGRPRKGGGQAESEFSAGPGGGAGWLCGGQCTAGSRPFD